MRLNRQIQYAFLLAFYLTRSGRARLEDVAANLSLSHSFLQQVARKMRIAKIVKSSRGPGGGYQLIGEPTAKEVLRSVTYKRLMLRYNEFNSYLTGGSETRTLLHLVQNLETSLNQVLDRKIKNVGADLVAKEMAKFNSSGAKMVC